MSNNFEIDLAQLGIEQTQPPLRATMYRFHTKQKAEVCGEILEYVVAGSGLPSVVLVNGAGGPIESWLRVFGPVSRSYSTLAYNRPGIGGSSKPQHAQTGFQMVASLHALLRSSNLPPPFILVGHSFGGLIANLYARLHPEHVGGVVLLEATSPEDPEQLSQHENWIQRGIRLLLDKVAPQSPHAETRHVSTTIAELHHAPAFPQVPLVVVSGTKPAMAWATAREAIEARERNQRELLKLSPLNAHILATKSGHFPQFSEPELVVSAIEKAVNWSLHANATCFARGAGEFGRYIAKSK
jgi:pimeloyl-ACP methyl ester carboxylesterase